VPERLIPIGEIVATHGIKGWLKLKPFNPRTAVLSSVPEVFLERGGASTAHSIEQSRSQKGHLLIKLLGVDGIDEAEKWLGATLSVAEDALQPLEPGEYYYYEVLGLNVFDTSGRWLGRVSQIWSKAGGDLYVVTGAAKEYLIPAVKEMIEKIDLPEKKMIINPPGGLLDL